jgi:hypothetical protein
LSERRDARARIDADRIGRLGDHPPQSATPAPAPMSGRTNRPGPAQGARATCSRSRTTSWRTLRARGRVGEDQGPQDARDHCTDASYDGLWHHAITTDRAEPNRPFHCDRCVIAADRAKIIRPSQRCLAPSMGSSAPHRHAGRACAPSPNTASHRRQTPKAHVDGQQPTSFGTFGRRGRDAINGLCAPMKNDRPWQTVILRRT